MRDAERAQPLRQFALRADQQRLVREGRRCNAHRIEHLELQRGVRDMVLAAHDMRDAHLNIVDRRGQHIEPRPVGAADDGIAHRRGIEFLGPTDQIVPHDRRGMIELEAPVRLDASGFEARPLGVAQRERGAVVDRRQPAPGGDLAFEVELLRGFVRRVDAAGVAQRRKARLIERKARRLPLLARNRQPEPGEIGTDRIDKARFAALGIGIVDPQPELAILRFRPQPIVERGADVADVQHASRRRGEASADRHATSGRGRGALSTSPRIHTRFAALVAASQGTRSLSPSRRRS